jgi:hypothetical protein
MKLDLNRVRENVRRADTQDLLNRTTAYRDGMEPEALAIIDEELRARGVSADERAAYLRHVQERALKDSDGVALTCNECRKPAVVFAWDWHRLWGLVPVFPRRFQLCEEHWQEHRGAWNVRGPGAAEQE